MKKMKKLILSLSTILICLDGFSQTEKVDFGDIPRTTEMYTADGVAELQRTSGNPRSLVGDATFTSSEYGAMLMHTSLVLDSTTYDAFPGYGI